MGLGNYLCTGLEPELQSKPTQATPEYKYAYKPSYRWVLSPMNLQVGLVEDGMTLRSKDFRTKISWGRQELLHPETPKSQQPQQPPNRT